MCTGIFFKTPYGYVFSRTMEFGIELKWEKVRLKNKKIEVHGTHGVFPQNRDICGLTDGINNYGLVVGTFYYPKMQYEYPRNYKSNKINIFCIKLNEYLLCNYTDCKSILKDLDNFNILLTPVNKKDYSLHWLIADKSGNCYILELVNGKLHYYDNSNVKVITNSPSFRVHKKDVEIARRTLSNVSKKGSFSQGTGAIGLPGDSSSRSRFVRANFYINNLITKNLKNVNQCLDQGIRILHNFDIPLGSVLSSDKKTYEVAQYTVSYFISF